MLRKLFTTLCLAALALPGMAQEPQPAPPAEEVPADGSTGFSPEAMQQWQAIEKELAEHENNPDKLLAVLEDCENRDLLSETRQLLRAIKAQVINKMIEDIFMTAEKEADILKAKALVTKLVEMIPDEFERNQALNEIEIQFADPAAMLQQVLQARQEQQAADAAAEDFDQAAAELSQADYDRIAAIRTELESMGSSDQQLEYLNSLLSKERRGVRDWIRPQMTQILVDELNAVQDAGIRTVEDVLKVKHCFARIIRYTYPERDKKAAMQKLETEFADPEALLRQIQEQERMMGTEPAESETTESETTEPEPANPEFPDDEEAEEVEEPETVTV